MHGFDRNPMSERQIRNDFLHGSPIVVPFLRIFSDTSISRASMAVPMQSEGSAI
jgi:hypothetical protein